MSGPHCHPDSTSRAASIASGLVTVTPDRRGDIQFLDGVRRGMLYSSTRHVPPPLPPGWPWPQLHGSRGAVNNIVAHRRLPPLLHLIDGDRLLAGKYNQPSMALELGEPRTSEVGNDGIQRAAPSALSSEPLRYEFSYLGCKNGLANLPGDRLQEQPKRRRSDKDR